MSRISVRFLVAGSALWLAIVATVSTSMGWTIGRYANGYDAERAVHCSKLFDVEHGRQKVEDCEAGRLHPSEAETVRRLSLESFLSGAARLAALVLSVPLLLAAALVAAGRPPRNGPSLRRDRLLNP